jgi:hypothetical protein
VLDPDEIERTGRALLALAEELRAGQPTPTDIELPEADMARRLGVDPEVLRSHRRLGNCPGLWRGVGRGKMWLVAATEAWAAIKLRR